MIHSLFDTTVSVAMLTLLRLLKTENVVVPCHELFMLFIIYVHLNLEVVTKYSKIPKETYCSAMS